MKIKLMAEGDGTSEERDIVIPAFEHILKHLLENEKIQPWMTIVILANTVMACVMQMRDQDQVQMLEYFNETLREAWNTNKDLKELVAQPRTGRPH